MRITADSPERLDRYLARIMPEHSRSKITLAIERGEVLVDGLVRKPSFKLELGSEIELDALVETDPHDLTPADIALDVCYESDTMLVINKPRGMATHPAATLKEPSLVNALLFRTHSLSSEGGVYRPGIVHRLDKETTGLIMIAKTDAAHRHLAAQIEAKTAARRYLAIAVGDIAEKQFTVDAPMARDPQHRLRMAIRPEGKRAVTHFIRAARVNAGTLLIAKLETGRTHQIRVHLQAVKHPVLGDPIYAAAEYRTAPLQLHAAYLAFEEPASGIRQEVFAPLPSDFLSDINPATLSDLRE